MRLDAPDDLLPPVLGAPTPNLTHLCLNQRLLCFFILILNSKILFSLHLSSKLPPLSLAPTCIDLRPPSTLSGDPTSSSHCDFSGDPKVWDTRQRTCCNSFDAHEEYISDMTFAADSLKLLGTSGDGTLSVCSLRKNKVLTQSEFSEDEPLSVVIMKNGRKVVCGTQNGVLLLYSWGHFKDCSDRFTGFQSNSIDVLLKLDEDRIITGSENGLISLVGVLPNRIIQPIAEHSEYPVERLAFSHDRKLLGSISHDQMLKLWDLDDLLQGSGNTPKNISAGSDSDNDDMDMDVKPSTSFNGSKKSKGKGVQDASNSFFADL